VTVDLQLHRAVITSRSAAARLMQLAATAPDEKAARVLEKEARALREIAKDIEGRLEEVLAEEPSYPLRGEK